jgi:hypothetical protein
LLALLAHFTAGSALVFFFDDLLLIDDLDTSKRWYFLLNASLVNFTVLVFAVWTSSDEVFLERRRHLSFTFLQFTLFAVLPFLDDFNSSTSTINVFTYGIKSLSGMVIVRRFN